MHQIIITYTVNKRGAWQMPLDVSAETAYRLDDKGYLAVAQAAERELVRQIKLAQTSAHQIEKGEHNAKSNKKAKA